MSEQYVDMELWKTIKKVLIEHESHCLDDKIDRFRIAQALYDGIASTPNRSITMDVLLKVRHAIFDEFKGGWISDSDSKTKETIISSTFTGKEDPGGWSPDAAVIIHCESGVPAGLYDNYILEKWYKVSECLETHYCEHINGGVIGVYEA